MPPPDKRYIQNAYSALKDNLEGFNKTPEEFEHLVSNDTEYRTKVYTALKDNLDGFDKSQQDFDNAIGIVKTPLPSIEQQMPDMGIRPVDTYQPKPDSHELPATKGDVASLPGVPSEHKIKQQQTAQASIKTAIDNSVRQKTDKLKKDGFSVDKKTEKFYRDQMTQMHDNGDLVVDKDHTGQPVLKKSVNPLKAMVNAVNDTYIEHLHNEILSGLSNKEKIEYLKAKPLLDEKYKSNEIPGYGAAGEIAKIVGDNAGVIGEGVVGAYVAPEMIGAKTVGSFIAMANGLAKSGYGGELQKTYHALVAQGVPEEQAMEQAHNAGLVGETTSLGTGAALSTHIKPSAANALLKGITKSLGYEAPKMALVSGASTLVNDLAESGLGVKKRDGEILNDVVESAGHGAVMGAAFWIAQHPGKILSYLRPQAENVIASIPKATREAFIKEAERAELIPKGDGEKIESKVEEFTKAKAPLENLDIPEENKAAIAGKILQKQKLQEELTTLSKHGEAFAPRIEELTNQIAGIEKEMAGMYKAKDVFEKESDSLTGEKPVEAETIQEGKDIPKLDIGIYGQGGSFLEGKEMIAEGSEHAVYRDGDTVIKVGEPHNSSETFDARVNDAMVIDSMLGDGTLKVEGTYNSKNGTINPVFRQKYVEGEPATPEQIDAHMSERGFVKEGKDKYTKEIDGKRYEFADLDGDNVRVDSDGKTHVIDASVIIKELKTPKTETDAISQPGSEPMGTHQGGDETTGGQESPEGVGEVNGLQEPSGTRSGQGETEGQDIKTVQSKAVVPVKEFVSKQGHTLTSDNGKITVISGKGKNIGKEVVPKTRNEVILEAAGQYDFTQGEEAPPPEFEPAHQGEYLRHVIEKTTSPVELAEVYINEEQAGKGLSTKERMIAEYGMGKVTEKSYRSFADKNSQNNAKSRAYFNKKGSNIDTLAKEISDHYGVEVSPEDVTRFIDRFPNGADAATAMRESDAALAAKDRFSELTGLPLDREIAEIAIKQQFAKLDKEVQDIAKQDYDTRQQLEAEYWKHFAESETNGGAEDGAGPETGSAEAGEAIDPAKPITNREKAEAIAQKILSFRSNGNNLYGGIAGVTTAIYDGMLSTAANVIRTGGSIIDAVDAAITYVQSNSPRADIEKVKEFLHNSFGIPYTKPTATPNALMQGKDVVDTGVRLHSLDQARDKIEQGIKEKKLSLWEKFSKKAFEGQVEILNRLKTFGAKGKMVADYLITSKGATAKADAFFDQAKDAIYGGIDGFKKVMVGGKPMRVQALLNKIVTLRRIIDIDQKMSDKFAEFTRLKTDIENLTALNPKDPKIIQLKREFENVKEYLDYNDMLVYDKSTQQYQLGQYRHPVGYTSDFAKNDLANIQTEHPQLYSKLHDRATLLSKTFHKLIDLKEEAGILSKESADALREYYYAPRADIENFVNAETDNASKGGKSKKDMVGIKRLQGGNEELIEDSYDVQLHKAVLNTMKDIKLNTTGQRLLEAVREKNDSDFFYENTPQIYQTGPNKGKLIRDKFGNIEYDEIPRGKAAIKVWENGKIVEIVGDQRLVDSWYDKHDQSEFVSMAGKITGAQILRGAITGYNPGFGIFQLLVDPQSAVVSSGLYKSYLGGLATVYKDMVRVSGDVFNPKGVSGVAAEARDYGAFTSFSRGEDVLNLRSDVDVNKRKALRALRATAEAFNWINDRAENLTRTALYSRSKNLQIEAYRKANGTDPVGRDLEDIKTVAARDARKYVDFARGGDFAKEANKIFPYLNAAIQLKRSVINAAAANPIRMATMTTEAVAAGVGVMAYSLGLGWASHGLSEEEKKKRIEAYRNVNQVTRSKYFLFYKGEDKDGKPQFWRIEKPMVLNVAINAAEKGMIKHYYPDLDLNAKTYAQDMEDLSPIDLSIVSRNPSLNAILKSYGNKDWYFNKDVVDNAENITDYLEGTDNKKTKDFYIWLGKKAKDVGVEGGISPMRTQAGVESFIGDPTQNPIVNLLTGTMALGFDAALGNKKALDERLKSFGDISKYLDFTTMPKRLIAQPSDITVEELKDWKERGQIKGDQKVLRKAARLGRTP